MWSKKICPDQREKKKIAAEKKRIMQQKKEVDKLKAEIEESKALMRAQGVEDAEKVGRWAGQLFVTYLKGLEIERWMGKGSTSKGEEQWGRKG